MTFTGWPRAAFDVLAQLQGDPPISVREEVRADREQLVRVPMVELLGELADNDPSYADHSVWHYGKTAWWWQNQAATIRIDRNIEIGLGLDFDGLRMQGAWWYGPAEQRDRYRSAVAGRAGARWQRIIDDLRGNGFEIGGDRMQRVPKGYPADHRRADLLKHRSVVATCQLGVEEWLFDPTAVQRVEAVCVQLRPMLEWLADHVVD